MNDISSTNFFHQVTDLIGRKPTRIKLVDKILTYNFTHIPIIFNNNQGNGFTNIPRNSHFLKGIYLIPPSLKSGWIIDSINITVNVCTEKSQLEHVSISLPIVTTDIADIVHGTNNLLPEILPLILNQYLVWSLNINVKNDQNTNTLGTVDIPIVFEYTSMHLDADEIYKKQSSWQDQIVRWQDLYFHNGLAYTSLQSIQNV